MAKEFTPGELYIWDSHFGYDIVKYVKPSGMYYHSAVENLTSKYSHLDLGLQAIVNDSLKPMTELDNMIAEYGYDQTQKLPNDK